MRLNNMPPKLLAAALLLALLSGCANSVEKSALGPSQKTQVQDSPIQERQVQVTASQLEHLLPTDIILLGEQHDAAEHQLLAQQVIAKLTARGLLAALALEMADAGSSTAGLLVSASEDQVKSALQWNDQGWPWAAYGPAVMTAVRAGVPVLGANLARASMRASMADSSLDAQLPSAALKMQQQLIREGHCDLLPDSQIAPMTRIQIAKDKSMADTLERAKVAGKVVVLLSGSGHTDRMLGVPQHLAANSRFKAVRLYAGSQPQESASFDVFWTTPALPEKDYCEGLAEQLAPAKP
jgi:uncharacterized iron-regulated protein